MARKKQRPISATDRRIVGGLLRELRRAAGHRSVEAVAALPAAPASRQTIYAYERGSLTPSLPQLLELVEFYVVEAPTQEARADLRSLGVATVSRALTLPAYHVAEAWDLIARLQPER